MFVASRSRVYLAHSEVSTHNIPEKFPCYLVRERVSRKSAHWVFMISLSQFVDGKRKRIERPVDVSRYVSDKPMTNGLLPMSI
jgi:hypothetical protein